MYIIEKHVTSETLIICFSDWSALREALYKFIDTIQCKAHLSEFSPPSHGR